MSSSYHEYNIFNLQNKEDKERIIMEWLSDNWEWVLLAFVVLEKVVKLSPSDKDDIMVDVLFQGLSKMVGKGKEESE